MLGRKFELYHVSGVHCIFDADGSLNARLSQARAHLAKFGDLNQTQIFAKIENVEVWDNTQVNNIFKI